MNLQVVPEIWEVPHTSTQLVTIPIIQIDEMMVRILSACTKAPVTSERIHTGKQLLINNAARSMGNSNILLWRISQLSDKQAYDLMIRKDLTTH